MKKTGNSSSEILRKSEVNNLIEFHCNCRHKDQTPIVSDLEIQEYAEAVLEDYKPKLLKEPGKINAVHFLESYLGATVDYQDIYYEENASPIAGAIVFNDDKVLVFDRENMCVRPIEVSAGTILIDNDTMKDGKEGFAQFTHLHEGGHFLIHPAVYRKMDNQITLFDLGMLDKTGSHVVSCKRSAIAGQGEKKCRFSTQEEFREHQANTFAAAIAMPRQTFIPYAQEMIRAAGFKDGIWVESEKELDWDDMIVLPDIVGKLAETFGVSRSAARVQLKRQNVLMTEKEYQQLHSQLAVAF